MSGASPSAVTVVVSCPLHTATARAGAVELGSFDRLAWRQGKQAGVCVGAAGCPLLCGYEPSCWLPFTVCVLVPTYHTVWDPGTLACRVGEHMLWLACHWMPGVVAVSVLRHNRAPGRNKAVLLHPCVIRVFPPLAQGRSMHCLPDHCWQQHQPVSPYTHHTHSSKAASCYSCAVQAPAYAPSLCLPTKGHLPNNDHQSKPAASHMRLTKHITPADYASRTHHSSPGPTHTTHT